MCVVEARLLRTWHVDVNARCLCQGLRVLEASYSRVNTGREETKGQRNACGIVLLCF